MTSKLRKMLFAGVRTNIQSFTINWGASVNNGGVQSFTDATTDGEEYSSVGKRYVTLMKPTLILCRGGHRSPLSCER